MVEIPNIWSIYLFGVQGVETFAKKIAGGEWGWGLGVGGSGFAVRGSRFGVQRV